MGIFGSDTDIVEFRYRVFDMLNYKPHKGQIPIHNSKARFRILAGAARSGKTLTAVREVEVEALNPKGQIIWIVAPTYSITEKIFREVFRDLTVKYQHIYPVVRKSWREKRIELATGTEIVGKSCENPVSLLGEDVGFMVCDEMSRIKREIFTQYLLHRLTSSKGRLLGVSTPCGKSNLFHDLFLMGQDDNYPEYFSSTCSLLQNPTIDKAIVMQIKKQMMAVDPDGYKQEVLGMFV